MSGRIPKVRLDQEVVTVVLAMPDKHLSPNRPPASMGGRQRKARLTKAYRKASRKATEELRVETGPWEQATVRVVFYHAEKRRRDDVNFLGMLKPAYDGAVDARLLVDDDRDHLETLGATFEPDKAFPRVELIYTRIR